MQITLGVGRNSAETQSKYIGSADPFLVKEKAPGLEQHTQYFSILEQYESWAQELQNLPPRSAYVKLEDRPAVKIRTLEVPQPEPDPEELATVLDTYRTTYQRTKEEAESALSALTPPAAAPRRVKRTVKQ